MFVPTYYLIILYCVFVCTYLTVNCVILYLTINWESLSIIVQIGANINVIDIEKKTCHVSITALGTTSINNLFNPIRQYWV